MAYRFQNDSKTTGQPPLYYARNRVYPGAYSRTEWPTRTSRRIHDGLGLSENYGLDTISDDVNSSPYSSPFYVNGRYLSDNLVTQRGNSASVQGTKLLATYGDEYADFSEDDIATTIKLWQGKQIKFKIAYSGKVVGNTITIKNTMGSTGILSIYLSASPNGKVISETSVDLCKVSMDKFEHLKLRPMVTTSERANPRGELFVRMEIYNEIELRDRTDNPFNTGKYIEIAATGAGDHYACEYTLQDKNVPVTEKYDYHRVPNRPLLGLIYNNYTSIPIDRIGNEKTGASVSKDGYRYDLFVVKNNNTAKMLVYDKETGKLTAKDNIKVDSRTQLVEIAEIVDTTSKRNVWVYYVDGYSPLQRFKIGKWDSEAMTTTSGNVSPSSMEVEKETGETAVESCVPVIGAQYIIHHNNRLYLSGFRNDPNLVQFSAIEETGPNYTAFPYRFYAPNNSPLALSTNTVTGVIENSSDQIMILGKNFYSLFSTNVNIESTNDGSSYPTQISSYTDSVGVASQGDVCNYKGVVYSFDPKEGIRRFSGAIWSVIPNSISSLFDRVDMNKRRKIWGFHNKLYFNYTDKVDGIQKCLVWDMEMNYQQYPWFQDIDLPFCDVRYDESEELVGIHPDYPCVMSLYAEDTWRRLDSPIIFERHTKFLSMPGNAADMIVKRVHNKIIANCNRWWWFGVETDKQQFVRERGRDSWYRMPSWDTLTVDEPVETPFPGQDIYEMDATERLTLSNLRIRCSAVQVKIKCKTFRAQASLVSTLLEAQLRQYN